MARKDHKNDMRRVTLPERMKMIATELRASGYELSANVFCQNSNGNRIIARQIRAHVRAEQERARQRHWIGKTAQ